MFKRIVVVLVLIIFAEPIYRLSINVMEQFQGDASFGQLIEKGEIILTEQTQNVMEQVATVNKGEPTSPQQETYDVEGQQRLTDAFYTAFSQWQTNFTISYHGDTSQIKKTIESAIAAAFSKNEYIEGHTGERAITYEYGKTSATIHVKQSYLTTPQQENVVNQQVQSVISGWNGLSDFEKVKAVNDYIVQHTVYTTQSAASPHSAYAVLVEGKGVCQGYALLALKMLQGLNIPTKYVIGYVGTEGHAWNLVKLDGQWYHMDPTWNDPVPDRASAVSYQYFLADDSTLAKDHTWKKENYPAATSKRFAMLQNADYAVESNGKLYFSHLHNDNQLYVMDLATLQSSPLSNSRALYLAVYGDWIYFSNYSNGAYIYKIRVDGTEEQLLYREASKDLYVKNGYLYFSSNGLKKIQL